MTTAAATSEWVIARMVALCDTAHALRRLLEAVDDDPAWLCMGEMVDEAVGKARIVLARLDEMEGAE